MNVIRPLMCFKAALLIDLTGILDRRLYKQDPVINSAPAYMATTKISMILNRQNDVIVLNSASIETAYQAVTIGMLIYEADRETRLEYESALRGLYFDFKPFLEKPRSGNTPANLYKFIILPDLPIEERVS